MGKQNSTEANSTDCCIVGQLFHSTYLHSNDQKSPTYFLLNFKFCIIHQHDGSFPLVISSLCRVFLGWFIRQKWTCPDLSTYNAAHSVQPQTDHAGLSTECELYNLSMSSNTLGKWTGMTFRINTLHESHSPENRKKCTHTHCRWGWKKVYLIKVSGKSSIWLVKL